MTDSIHNTLRGVQTLGTPIVVEDAVTLTARESIGQQQQEREIQATKLEDVFSKESIAKDIKDLGINSKWCKWVAIAALVVGVATIILSLIAPPISGSFAFIVGCSAFATILIASSVYKGISLTLDAVRELQKSPQIQNSTSAIEMSYDKKQTLLGLLARARMNILYYSGDHRQSVEKLSYLDYAEDNNIRNFLNNKLIFS